MKPNHPIQFFKRLAVALCSFVSDSLRPQGLHPARLLCPDKKPGVGCRFLLQGVFLTQGWKLRLLHSLHWRILYHSATWEALLKFYP